MSGFLLLTYTYCIEGFVRRQNKPGILVFNSSFSPHWKCHCPPPFPSFTFPPSHWPRLLSHGRCTDGARLEIAKTWTIICLTERRTLRAEGWGQSSLRFFCDSLSRSQVTLNTLPVHRATRTVWKNKNNLYSLRRFLITAVFSRCLAMALESIISWII